LSSPRIKLLGLALPLLVAGCALNEPAADADDPRLARMVAGRTVADRCLTPDDEPGLADELFNRINQEREVAGLPPVRRAPVLDRIAGDYACKMVRNSFFAHLDPADGAGPGQRAMNAGYRFYAVGENLAAGHLSVEDAMASWMSSEAHREIILGPNWSEVGLAVRVGGPYETYWVQEFGEPVDEALALAGR